MVFSFAKSIVDEEDRYVQAFIKSFFYRDFSDHRCINRKRFSTGTLSKSTDHGGGPMGVRDDVVAPAAVMGVPIPPPIFTVTGTGFFSRLAFKKISVRCRSSERAIPV